MGNHSAKNEARTRERANHDTLYKYLRRMDGVRKGVVPRDGQVLPIPIDPRIGLSHQVESPRARSRQRLVALIATPTREILNLVEARTPTPDGIRTNYLVSRPPEDSTKRAALVGMVEAGFPLRIPQPEDSDQTWDLVVSYDPDGLNIRQYNQPDTSSNVFIPDGPAVMDADLFPIIMWAPTSEDVAFVIGHQATMFDQTAVMSRVA